MTKPTGHSQTHKLLQVNVTAEALECPQPREQVAVVMPNGGHKDDNILVGRYREIRNRTERRLPPGTAQKLYSRDRI